MTDIFENYANFYDVLYGEKNYSAEIEFIQEIIQRYSKIEVQRLLDLGCGTGSHSFNLSERGYMVTGIDGSPQMIAHAKSKLGQMGSLPHPPEFMVNDIRDFNFNTTFDVVISMFAVISYISTNQDLLTVFRNIRHHLNPGGLFVFDAWFGPGVLNERPSDRYKIIESGSERLIRFVHSEIDVINHVVDINYHLMQLSEDKITSEIREIHRMRYWFVPEIMHLAELSGMRLLYTCPFMQLDRKLSETDWNFTAVLSTN